MTRIFAAAVGRVEPGRLVRERLVVADDGVARLRFGPTRTVRLDARRIWVVAAGKAGSAMAAETWRILGRRIAGGVVSAPEPPSFPRTVRRFSGGHPVPNGASQAAGTAVWRMLGRAAAEDVVLVLLSGGASSLLALPARGIRLRDTIATTELLLRSGAPIREVNAVRKHLSRLKGGGLARRARNARVFALLLSDVVGDSPAVIGSGPAAADPTTYDDAWRVLKRRGILERVPPAVRRRLERGRRGTLPETPKRSHARHLVIGDNRLALAAAADYARSLGLESEILTDALRGDTRTAAAWFVERIRARRSRHVRARCLLAGGETTIDVTGSGRGGRNQEFALALVEPLADLTGVACLSAGSDGIDGPTDAAGAFVDHRTLARCRRLGLAPGDFLDRNDSYEFFRRLGDLFRPGPTGTNVMDLKIAVVRGRGRS